MDLMQTGSQLLASQLGNGAMASGLNSDEDSILNGLRDALPQLIDNSSKSGSLLDNPGDLPTTAAGAAPLLG